MVNFSVLTDVRNQIKKNNILKPDHRQATGRGKSPAAARLFRFLPV